MGKRELTIEPGSGHTEGQFDVYEHGVYERSSVLHGQPKRTWKGSFDTVAEALEAYPDAVESCSTKPMRFGNSLGDMSGLPDTAPDWFDEGYAGERWDEDY